MRQTGRFTGQVALVTGAARGIGRAIAARLAEGGARVMVTDVDAEAARATAEALSEGGTEAFGAGLDVRRPQEARDALLMLERRGLELDILVNNAGVVRDGALHKMDDETWDLVNGVIATGAFNMCRAAAPMLRRPRSDGAHRKVVNVASVSGVYGRELSANYCAAKAALIGLTKALAREWAGRRVNVNAVAPGFVGGTALTTPSADGRDSMRRDFHDRIVAQIPLGRGGTPEDIAGVVAFLASSDADYVTGQVLEAHGGLEILKV